MIGKTEVKGPLLDHLDSYLRNVGFEKNVGRQSFYRQTLGGREAFHIALIARVSGVEVVPDVALRLDVLEELIFENTTNFVAKEQRKNTYTIGRPLGGEVQPSGWLVHRLDDIPTACQEIVVQFNLVAEPFFRKFENPETIYNALSSSAPNANRLCPDPISRALRTLGLAYLLKRTDDFDLLALNFELELARNDDPDFPVFQTFRDNLRATLLSGEAS